MSSGIDRSQQQTMAVDSKKAAKDAVDSIALQSKDSSKPSPNKKKRKRTTSSGGESILANSSVKASPAKKVRKKKRKDVNAPHKPLNPYVMFLNETRESVRIANPESTFPQVTKILAAQWTKMSEEQRQPYLQQAAKDRERYSQELSVYRTTDNYRQFQESKKEAKKEKSSTGASKEEKNGKNSKKRKVKKKNKQRSFSPIPFDIKTKKSSNSGTNDANAKPTIDSSDIPIFTEAFLNHNKLQESELRRLRKLTTDFEEANAILSKHIDNMNATERKLRDEIKQMTEKNEIVDTHLRHLNGSLLDLFNNYTSCSLIKDFISNHLNGGSSLTLDHLDQLVDFIHAKLTHETPSGKSVNKENSLLREKVKNLIEQMHQKQQQDDQHVHQEGKSNN